MAAVLSNCTGSNVVIHTFPADNSPPIAIDDDVPTDEDTVLNGDVLVANPTTPDRDPDGDPITVTQVNVSVANAGIQIGLVSEALLTVNAYGTFAYDPNDQFESLSGGLVIDSFTHTIGGDGGATDTGAVTVSISGLNDPPVIMSDVGGAAASVDVSENQIKVTDVKPPDPEGDTDGLGLTYSLSGSVDDGFFSIATNSGVVTFITAQNFEDAQEFGRDNTYDTHITVTDSGGFTDTQYIAVDVGNVEPEDVPPAANDDSYAATGNVSITVDAANCVILSGGGAGADDNGGGTITVTAVQGSAGNVGTSTATDQNGSVTLAADGSFAYDNAERLQILVRRLRRKSSQRSLIARDSLNCASLSSG